MLYRKIEEKIEKYMQSSKKKVLLVDGARQVGNNVKLEIM